ncbi:MAG: substrate-binding domain-containing protein [Christensenellales bacterium]|jgi:phosphate transport system substrate-binding protein
MKKIMSIIISVMLLGVMLYGCADTNNKPDAGSASPAASEAPESNFDSSREISVISREDGSGTRGAFVELMGIEEKDDDGNKMDMTSEEAIITNSTNVMMTTVAGNPYSIGYISLGSLNNTVKAVQVDGVDATVDNIKSGEYTVARPFNIATMGELSDAAQDFMDFIMSSEGQAIVEESGYIAIADDSEAYAGNNASGKVVVAGSSSITPVMEKLKEGYATVNTNVEVEIQQSDSSTGMTSAVEGICDIGMASRELKDSELEAGLTPVVIAMDGIAVIVHNDNPVESLTSDQIKGIFKGEAGAWSDLNA